MFVCVCVSFLRAPFAGLVLKRSHGDPLFIVLPYPETNPFLMLQRVDFMGGNLHSPIKRQLESHQGLVFFGFGG